MGLDVIQQLCVVNSCSNWHVGPLGFSISDNLVMQGSNEIVLWKDMLFFSISIWEVVDWTEYFQFQTISLNGCEVWDCFVIEGKEHSAFFYGKSNIVFLLDYCFSLCVSFVSVGYLFLFLFLFVYLELIVSLSVSFVSLSFCFSTVRQKAFGRLFDFYILQESSEDLRSIYLRLKSELTENHLSWWNSDFVLERAREQQRETGVTVRERRGEGISEHMYRSCGCCWRWSGSTECRSPGGGEEEVDQATRSSFPGAGFTRCCCK